MECYVNAMDVQDLLSNKYKELTILSEGSKIPSFKASLESQCRLLLQMKAQIMLLEYKTKEDL